MLEVKQLLSFKNFDLLFDNEFPTLEEFKTLFRLGKFHRQYGQNLYEFSIDLQDNRYFIITCDYDGFKYRPKVYDTVSEIEDDNPRKPFQNELRQQFFACYDILGRTLYISDSAKKGILKKYMEEMTQKKVKTRERFSSFDEFERTVKFLKSIRWIQSRNLLNLDPQGLFAQRYSPLGLEVPDSMTTKLEYGRLSLEGWIHKLRTLGEKKAAREFESVVIIGEDAFGAEKSFDFDSMITSKLINIDMDENGRYNAYEVVELLLIELRKDNVQEE